MRKSPTSEELKREKGKHRPELQWSNNGLPYYNHSASRSEGSHSHERVMNIPSNDSDFIDPTFLPSYNIKSPYNNRPISRLRRAIVFLTVFSVILGGPTALLGGEVVSEEEKKAYQTSANLPIKGLSDAEYARIKQMVINMIAEEGITPDGMPKQSTTFINPAETPKVLGKEAN